MEGEMKTDLSYLKTMSGDNQELIQEMIEIFTCQVGEFEVEMQSLLDREEYDLLGKLAHKAKSSVAIMGMDHLSAKLKELEMLATSKKEVDKYQSYINLFRSECAEAVSELESYKKSIAH
jgi:HPt (histidine-containing phosphotransfer) domain-containing protein